jgi:hypothetical protein
VDREVIEIAPSPERASDPFVHPVQLTRDEIQGIMP